MKFRKYVSAPGLLDVARDSFAQVRDFRDPQRVVYSLSDVLMSATAMFALKYPSLLQFDEDSRREDIRCQNLRSVYGLSGIPSDTQMRAIIDQLAPKEIHRSLKRVFSHLQQGKVLEGYHYIDDAILVAGDGTGLYSSEKVRCKNCCEKSTRSGESSFYHQAFSMVVVHPSLPQVLPICLETISKEDGASKNDCEINAAKRALKKLRKEHPHLKMRLVLDGLFPKASILRLAEELDFGFIAVAKEGDHKALFEYFDEAKKIGDTDSFKRLERKGNELVEHSFTFANSVPLNDQNADFCVNVLEYEQTIKGQTTRWVWITDLRITKGNAYSIMRAGRARWRIENETYNILKNHGYEFEHNFGHGNENLCTNLFYVMMLAFLIDQVQELSCKVFGKLLGLAKRKKYLWQQMQSVFRVLFCESFAEFYQKIGETYDKSFVINTG